MEKLRRVDTAGFVKVNEALAKWHKGTFDTACENNDVEGMRKAFEQLYDLHKMLIKDFENQGVVMDLMEDLIELCLE